MPFILKMKKAHIRTRKPIKFKIMVPRRVPNEPICVPVPALHAFVFDKKYLVDDSYLAEMTRRIDDMYVVHLDGVQLDRVSVTAALKTAYPTIDAKLGTKILMIDFAYYVLQGHAHAHAVVDAEFVVVPINQQSNDLRAANLVLLPGSDRKLYRGTDIVPRDGLCIGGGFLPRSLTIIKMGEPGQYQFKISSKGERKVIGFEASQAAQVFRDKVVPLLHANDADFLANDVVYQDLCASYLMAFPLEATTEAPPYVPPKEKPAPRFYPDSKAQRELARKQREDRQAEFDALENEGLRACGTCRVVMRIEAFEAMRRECKDCRQTGRTERARETVAMTESASLPPPRPPKPSACISCGRGPDDVDFKWRTDVICGSWRNECTSCYNAKDYSVASRARRREENEEGYLSHNATTHLAWALKNPEKVKEQQILSATVPERKMKTIVTSAEKRGIHVNLDDVAEMQVKLSLECEYCGFVPNEYESLNGLDRVDSVLGYTSANTLPCCATCNAMKGALDVDVFITNVRNIDAFIERTIDVVTAPSPRVKLSPFSGRAELRDAPKKEKKDLLTHEYKVDLWSSPCYLCGQSPSFGIDRVDASGDYTTNNTKPCCTECNYMKKDMRLCDFIAHVGYVAERTRMWMIGDVADKPFKVFGGKTRDPVATTWGDGKYIIFPSGGTAGIMMGVSHNKVLKSIKNGTKCKGYNWVWATARDFRHQSDVVDIQHHVHEFLTMIV